MQVILRGGELFLYDGVNAFERLTLFKSQI